MEVGSTSTVPFTVLYFTGTVLALYQYSTSAKKIKDRKALTQDEQAKVTAQLNNYCIGETTDACYLLLAIEGVVSKLYCNWKRDLTKTVVYEMLYV